MPSSDMLNIAQTFNKPKPRESKTKYRCDRCREKKLACSFRLIKNGPWPARCDLCLQKNAECSEPRQVSLKRCKATSAGSSRGGIYRLPYTSPNPQHVNLKPLAATANAITSPGVTASPTADAVNLKSKERVLLLSIHSVLLMAIKDMVDMAVIMLRPLRRDTDQEHTEERIPVLEQAIHEYKTLSRKVRAMMLAVSGDFVFARAQDALSALATPYFRPERTWGIDQISLDETRTSISWFYSLGHFSLAYVLQTKLLQAGVMPTQDEVARLLLCKLQFMKEVDTVINSGHLPFSLPFHWSGCQMFAPKELVCVPAVASHILHEKKPDLLGRSSFHILADAGANIKWGGSGQEDGSKSVYFFANGLGPSIEWPIQAINNTDCLGRTALHIAVRQGNVSSVMVLSGIGADMHQLCLNGLSLLHIAACHGHETVVRHLVNKMHYHECEEQCTGFGEQCQECSTRYSHKLDLFDDLSRTPFWYAARGSHFEVMKFLAEDVRLKDSSKQFITVRADTEHEDVHGHSALAKAARDGRIKVLKYLLGLRDMPWHPHTTWRTMVDDFMLHEHLLLAHAVQSRNRECVKLIHRHRKWRFGGHVFDRAKVYADERQDEALRAELHDVYKFDLRSAAGVARDATRELEPMTTVNTLTSSDPWFGWETW